MTATLPALSERLDFARRSLWMALIAAATIAFSRTFACAMPLAALATLAALNMRRGEAAALMLIVWIVDQAVGFLLLHYPHTVESFEWGGAIGVAAFLALGGAMAISERLQAYKAARGAGAFVLAFALYEAALYTNALALREGGDAFTPAIIGKILTINLAALGGLFVLHAFAVKVRLISAYRGPVLA